MNCGIMPDVVRFVKYYREHLPEWVFVAAPMPTGVFSKAMDLRGSSFLVDILDEPEQSHRLLSMCAEMLVKTEIHIRNLIGSSVEKRYTNFGITTPGLRISDDAICNLSPQMIKDFFLSYVQVINKHFNGYGHVHFCSLPEYRYEHIYPVFAESEDIRVVSSQLGFEYYAEHLNELRNRLAVEALYAPAYKYICEKYGSFKDWAYSFVPRFKNESGLVLYMQAGSLEEGREIWDVWQNAHKKDKKINEN